MVDKGTLNSVRNIFQGGELGLNLITHLQRKGKEVEAGDQDENLETVQSDRESTMGCRRTTDDRHQHQALEVQGTCKKRQDSITGSSSLHPKELWGSGEKCRVCGLTWHGPSASK